MRIQQDLIATQSRFISCSSSLDEQIKEVSALNLANQALQNEVNSLQTRIAIPNDTEAKLAVALDENTQLKRLLDELEKTQEELLAALEPQGPLMIDSFEARPDFCNRSFSGEWVCMTSITLVTSLNYNPDAQMRVTLIDPDGTRIGQKEVTGKKVNRFQLLTDERFLIGEYQVQFEIDGVLDENKTFMVRRP
ncbi:hypothetical protein PN836_016395 [Ningiella sp. W23]|uniref:hypothetical protein n=1 Tax=Ningiella sp. W23 TaxID=3023715 RepID=UPI0037575017